MSYQLTTYFHHYLRRIHLFTALLSPENLLIPPTVLASLLESALLSGPLQYVNGTDLVLVLTTFKPGK